MCRGAVAGENLKEGQDGQDTKKGEGLGERSKFGW